MNLLVALMVAAILGIAPMIIASGKGRRHEWAWWAYGTVFFVIALVHALLLHPQRPCPLCAGMIRSEAVVCRHCTHAI